MNDGLFDNLNLGDIKITNQKTTKQKSNKVELADSIQLGSVQLFSDSGITVTEIVKDKPEKKKETDIGKLLKSKKLSLQERLAIINKNVLSILGKQSQNVVVIKTREALHDYITKSIENNVIAVDTETNNSLDPVTCKLMGPCLYTPNEKQAYIPLNHRDPETKERYSWQLTEQDCKEEFQRLVDAKTDIIMHNGKFDYEVIKCTCGIELPPTWDTMVAARLINENELAGLKAQYIKYIDKTQSKYDIEKLFVKVAYADVDPNIFALYAATDSLMTYKLYERQKEEFDKPEYGPHIDIAGKHEIKGLRWLFHEVEMPIVVVTAEMELLGVKVDPEFGARLKEKYEAQLTAVDAEINKILESLNPIIAEWKLLPESAAPAKVYASKKSKMTKEKLEATYPHEDEFGRYKYGKTLVEQLEYPINFDSTTQLAILFYSILGVSAIEAKDVYKKTGKDELKAIKERYKNYLSAAEDFDIDSEDEESLLEEVEEAVKVSDNKLEKFKQGTAAKLADLILKHRGIMKLTTTYIDVIPDLAKHWSDGRIRFHLNSLGTDTGRYSSGGKISYMENEEQITVSGINIQNIPSHNPEIRMLFKAETTAKLIEADDNEPFIIDEISDVEMVNGWVRCKNLKVGDLMLVDGIPTPIKAISYLTGLRQYSIEV